MESVRKYLAQGGRLNFDAHRELVDALSSAESWTTDERADRAMTARYAADTLADGGELVQGRHLTPDQRAEATQASLFLAEFLEAYPDPGLEQQIRGALPEPLALHLEAQTRPHPIRVGVPVGEDFWSCDSCGSTHGVGEGDALLIGDRAGHSRTHPDIVICRDCILQAASALRTGTPS